MRRNLTNKLRSGHFSIIWQKLLPIFEENNYISMSIQLTFAVPSGNLYAPLTSCAGTNRIIVASNEKECASLLMNHRVDAALISPLHYGLSTPQADYRIIPTTGIFFEGFANYASIWFAQGMANLQNYTTTAPNDFIVTAGRILLAERYGLHPKFIASESVNFKDDFLRIGCAISYRIDLAEEPSLDIAEDWLDSFEIPLPAAIWACRQDDDIPVDLPEIIRGLAGNNFEQKILVSEHFCDNPEHHHDSDRQGIIHRHWNTYAVESLESTLDLLYYHQFLPVIAEAKFWKE